MFNKPLAALALASAVLTGSFALAPTTAEAGGIRAELYFGTPMVETHIGHRRHRAHRRGHRDWDRGWRRDRFQRCSPRRALRKARRMGVRRAHVIPLRRGGKLVRGYRFHRPVAVAFGGKRWCPVRFVKHRRGW